MYDVLRNVWPLFMAIALLMVGNGLQGTLLGLRASHIGFDTSVTGIVMAAYYGGYLVSAMVAPQLVAAVGHIRVFAAFASIASSTVLLHALFPDPVLWTVIRFITGFATAALYVVAESWLNGAASDETRGRILSFYMVVIYACMAFGQYLLSLTDPAGFAAFVLVSLLVSLALVPIALAPRPAPVVESPPSVGLLELYRHSPLGFMCCFLTGAANGAFLSMGPVYADLLGLGTGEIALLMGLPLAAVIATQFPIGAVSDRVDRRWVIFAVALLVGLIGFALIFAGASNMTFLVLAFAAYGAISAPLYSLAIAHSNDKLDPSRMLGASARLVLVFGTGSIAGPLLAGGAMAITGAGGFFITGSVIHLLLAAFALYRITRQPAIPAGERGEFVHVSLRATPVATTAAIDAGDRS